MLIEMGTHVFWLDVYETRTYRVYLGLSDYGVWVIIFCYFSKEDNLCDFLFASLHHRTLPKRGLLFKKRGANSFLEELTPIGKGAGVENGRVPFPDSHSVPNKLFHYFCNNKQTCFSETWHFSDIPVTVII